MAEVLLPNIVIKKIRKRENFEKYYLGNRYYFEKHHCTEKQDNWHLDSKPVVKIVLPKKWDSQIFYGKISVANKKH